MCPRFIGAAARMLRCCWVGRTSLVLAFARVPRLIDDRGCERLPHVTLTERKRVASERVVAKQWLIIITDPGDSPVTFHDVLAYAGHGRRRPPPVRGKDQAHLSEYPVRRFRNEPPLARDERTPGMCSKEVRSCPNVIFLFAPI
jgi:hypothetical protein